MLCVALCIIAVFVIYQLSGNRKTKAADPAAREDALRFAAPPGMARLYLVREGYIGMAVGADVEIDGRVVAQIKGQQFTMLDLSPGAHAVEVQLGGVGKVNTSREISLAEGAVSALWVQTVMGWVSKGSLRLTEETNVDALRKRIPRLKMVQPDAPALVEPKP